MNEANLQGGATGPFHQWDPFGFMPGVLPGRASTGSGFFQSSYSSHFTGTSELRVVTKARSGYPLHGTFFSGALTPSNWHGEGPQHPLPGTVGTRFRTGALQ